MGLWVVGSQNKGYHFGDPNNKDYIVFGGLYWGPLIQRLRA